MSNVKGKIVIVIGGNGLLGKAIVDTLRSEGAVACIGDISPEGTDSFRVSVCEKKSIEGAIKSIIDRYGKIDCVVNCSYPRNPCYGRHFFDVDYTDFCENLNLHLGGYFLVTQVFASAFKKQGFGNIINFSSVYGEIAPRFDIYDGTTMTMPVEYASIKAGIAHLTRYVASYLRGESIRVNSISPGGIINNQPASFLAKYKAYCLNKGMLDPQDVVGALLFLISDDSRYINGQNIVVDDGFSI